MNNTNKKEKKLFEKVADMAWVLHNYHLENHAQSKEMRNNYEKKAENRLLSILKLQEEISKKELLFILDVPEYHFYRMLDKMNKEECILFIEKADDIIIKITEKGKSIEIKEKKSEFDSIFDCLTEEEKINFSQYIDTIVSSVKPKLHEKDSDYFHNFERDNFSERNFGFHGMNRDFDRHNKKSNFHRHPGFDRRCSGDHRPHEYGDFDRCKK